MQSNNTKRKMTLIKRNKKSGLKTRIEKERSRDRDRQKELFNGRSIKPKGK